MGIAGYKKFDLKILLLCAILIALIVDAVVHMQLILNKENILNKESTSNEENISNKEHFNPHVEFVKVVTQTIPYSEIVDEGGNRKIVTAYDIYYDYLFGVAGNFNYSAFQTRDFDTELRAIVGDGLINYGIWHSNPAQNKGFERGLVIAVRYELTDEQIERIRKLIEEFLY